MVLKYGWAGLGRVGRADMEMMVERVESLGTGRWDWMCDGYATSNIEVASSWTCCKGTLGKDPGRVKLR